jgi:hypothetical protein
MHLGPEVNLMIAVASVEPAWVWSALSVVGAAALTALSALLAIWILHRVTTRRPRA